jgi:hypothetical protein
VWDEIFDDVEKGKMEKQNRQIRRSRGRKEGTSRRDMKRSRIK